MHRILHLESDKYSPEALTSLSGEYDMDLFHGETQSELYRQLESRNYFAIFTRIGLMLDEQALSTQPGLRFIVTSTTGLNHIDLEAAARRNIQVISLKGEEEFLSTIKSTAEHTWALLMALIRNLNAAQAGVRNQVWDRTPYLADELDGNNLGIIGYGRLGKILARYGKAFGMKVWVHDRDESKYRGEEGVIPCELPVLLAHADFVLLMITYEKQNEGFMDAEKFSRLKKGAYFVNTSRGEMVDELALLDALRSGHLKGAALDVLSNDSAWDGHVAGSPELMDYFSRHHNLIITPHIGGFGLGSMYRTRDFITRKFLQQAKAYSL